MIGAANDAAADESTAAPIGPLDGIRIIDWTIWQQGPVAGAMLGDLGAEVIKIEERERGDGGRQMFVLPGGDGASPYWEMNNRNKRSVAIDLKKPEGVEVVRRLIANADVFIQNFRPSIAEKVGLDYETLKALNPRLIYASASAFGTEGSERTARAYDLLGQARSGLLLRDGHEDEPDITDGGLADQMGAIMLAYGVLAALIARERHDIGQKVDTSLLGSMMWLRGLPFARELMKDRCRATSDMGAHRTSARPSRRDPGNPLWNTYKCADGRWLAFAALSTDQHWQNVVEAMGNPPELARPGYSDHWGRCANAREIVAILDPLFAAHPRDYWLERLVGRGDLPVCAINTTAEAIADPQVLLNGYITEFEHPSYGRVRTPGFPVKLSRTPARIRRQAPEFGEHTEEVLIELVGLAWGELDDLRARAVI